MGLHQERATRRVARFYANKVPLSTVSYVGKRDTVESLAPRPDDELIAASLDGDRSAFGALVLRYRKLVLSVAYRICGDRALADDVAQETFVRVWEKLDTFRPEGNWRGWICRIASNLTVDALRRQDPSVDIAQLSLAALDGQPERRILEAERAEAVRSAILRLPMHVRIALVLREYEELSYTEIAEALDIPLGTVKSRLSDARRRLGQELAPYMEE
jgi:RNA polymerase sigma-70 factor (ECF subfamily)